MKLPGGDRAIVADEKLLGYLLNPEHEHGASKAYLFKALLGIDRQNAEVLQIALLNAAREGEAFAGRRSPYGQKYEIRFAMGGPRGEYTVLSVWIVPESEGRPVLVTAYVE